VVFGMSHGVREAIPHSDPQSTDERDKENCFYASQTDE